MAKRKQGAINIVNKKAKFEFAIEQSYTAGVVLQGTEIKSIRQNQVSFTDCFCIFQGNELFIRNLHIAEYSHGTYANHDPVRYRKLLLNRKELNKIHSKIKEKGFTIIPLRIFINEYGFAKVEIALARGKKLFDKRATIKEREAKINLKRQLN